MIVKLNISDVVVDAFKNNLGNYSTHPAIIKAIIKQYLNDCIDKEDIDMHIGQYLDGLEESGDLDDIVYQTTLK